MGVLLWLDYEKVTLRVEDTFLITANVSCIAPELRTVHWASSDNDVVSVSSSGELTALKEGSATITATSAIDPDAFDTCVVNVSGTYQNEGKTKLDIFSFNDFHGNVKDTENKGIGIAKTSTLLKDLSAGTNSIFISQGDMWQGSVESNYTHGLLVTEWMNSLDFVSMTVGNHEFDWGDSVIKENEEIASFPFLGINVINEKTKQRVDYLDASTTFYRDNAKIGVIGAIGNCLSSISSSNVPDIYFATGDELSELIKEESKRLRIEEGCDFIIYSVHGSGTRDEEDFYDLELSSGKYVDLVLEGHTHNRYAERDAAGIYHIQGNAYNQSFYRIGLDLDYRHDTFSVSPKYYSTTSYSSYASLEEDAEASALIEKYYPYFSFLYEDLGQNASFRDGDFLRYLVSELYLEEGKKKWASYPIALGGGYLSCRGRGLDSGMVTYDKIAELFPFDNDVVLCSVRAKDFINTSYYTMENSSYFVTWSQEGQQIKANLTQGKFEDDDLIYLVTDTYNSDYAPNHLTVIDRLMSGGMYARDLLAQYVKDGGLA